MTPVQHRFLRPRFPIPLALPLLAFGLSTLLASSALLAGSAGAAPEAPRFEEIGERAGLTMVLRHHPTPDKHLIETMTGGVAAFDYDGDGRTDLFFVNGAPVPGLEKEGPDDWNRLYRNEGELRFRDVTEEAGVAGVGFSMGAAAADYDNDGDVDLFVAGVNRNQLLRNDGRGRFEDVTAQAGVAGGVWSVAAAWLDYDRDGRLDLFVVNYLQWSPERSRFCGDTARNIRVYCHPRFFEGLPNALYRNRGDGTFEDVSMKSGIAAHVGKGMSAAVLDADVDGWPDVFVTNDAVPNFLFRNKGDGTFEEIALVAGVAVPAHGRPVSGMGVDARDVDGDGRPDLHFTALSGETFPLFRNQGAGLFDDATHATGLAPLTVRHSGWGTSLADFDNDGRKDLFVATGHVNDRIHEFEASAYEETNSLFRNAGGRFEDVSSAAGFEAVPPRPHRGHAAADFDGNGTLDLVVTALGNRPELWRNPGTGGHWIAFRLVGTRSNRDGIGARISVAGQTNVMTTSVGYASSVHAPVHFGLGAATSVERVEITWPSGEVHVLERPEVDRVHTVKEAG